MNYENLSLNDLNDLKIKIDARFETLNKVLKQEQQNKNRLSDLEQNDLIYCIIFKDSKVINNEYVKIIFYKDRVDEGLARFSTEHDTKPIGVSSVINIEQLSYNCFLSDFVSTFYFFTLNPENWKNDLEREMRRTVTIRKTKFDKDLKRFIDNVSSLINNDEVANYSPK